jgi:hypothetical protein
MAGDPFIRARSFVSTAAAGLAAVFLLTLSASAQAAPSITTLSPTSGAVGASITITGSGFGSTQGTSTVKFNGTTASATSWSATSIVATVPAGATTGNVVVTVSGVASAGKAFTVVAAPSITSLSPTSGAAGASVTVAGTAFGSTQGASTVKFNGTTATVTSWSATSVVVTVPAAATTGNVVVHASGVDSNGKPFTVLPTPTISTLTPSTAAIGASVVIAGTNFGATQGTSTVKFNGTTASATSWSATSITATVPAGATTGNVVVTVSGVASAGKAFTVVAAPSITSLSPTSGAPGTVVTITGTNFGAAQGTGTVSFNGTAGTPTSWNATTIKVPVPTGATTGNVVVRASGVDSNGKPFTVPPSPIITSLSPNSGLPGSAVTIAGSNFGATKGSSTVKFNGITAATTSWSATSIGVSVPAAATTGNVVVTVSSVASNGVTFTVPTLTSIAVTPSNPSVPVGATQQYVATGSYSDSVNRNITASAVWTSSLTDIATIASGGRATGVTEGDTMIQAALSGLTGSANLRITASPFVVTGNLQTPRRDAQSALLPNGNVLVAGGFAAQNNVLNTAEIYDTAKGAFRKTGNLLTRREAFTATALPTGQVLIVGGWDRENLVYVGAAELYDPATGTFTPAGDMAIARGYHDATLLANGQVLITGGGDNTLSGLTPRSELYDPATGTFALTGDFVTPRGGGSPTLLANGTVLFAGGHDDTNTVIASAEIYDPATGLFHATGAMGTASFLHTSTRLSDGRVLIAGGYNANSTVIARAEIYDPVAGTFSPTGSMSAPRQVTKAFLLGDGRVLVPGGNNGTADLPNAELFDPAAGSFSLAGNLVLGRNFYAGTQLLDGTVLLAGGSWGDFFVGGITASSELYLPGGVAPTPTSLQITPSNAQMLVGDTRLFRAVDNSGRPRPDAVWSIDNATLASLADDGSPAVTAVAGGSVTLTAAVGGVSAQATITILAQTSFDPGTVLWSAPSVSGRPASQLVQGSSSSGGPDLYAITDDGTEAQVQALTTDGQQLWRMYLPPLNGNTVPDGLGGFIVTEYNTCDNVNPMRIVNFDGLTGQWKWEVVGASACTLDTPQFAIGHGGVVAVVSPGNTSGFPELMRIDGRTGTLLTTPAIPQSTFEDMFGNVFGGYSRVGPPVIDADGILYVLYELRRVTSVPAVATTAMWLMKIFPDGSYTQIQLMSTDTDTNLFPGRIVPDTHGGVVTTWTFSPSHGPADPNSLRAAYVSGGGAVTLYNLPVQPAAVLHDAKGLVASPLLALGENDVMFASYGSDLMAFDPASGAASWSYSAAPDTIAIVVTDASNGVAAKVTGATGEETVVRFDAAGNAAVQPLTGQGIDHLAGDWWLRTTASDLASAYSGTFLETSSSGYSSPTQKGKDQQKPNLITTPSGGPDPRGGDTAGLIISRVKTELEAEAALPGATCGPWLTNPANPQLTWSAYLAVLTSPSTALGGHAYGHGVMRTDQSTQIDIDTIAVKNGKNPNAAVANNIPEGWLIMFNDNGAFYNARNPSGGEMRSRRTGYLGGTPRQQAETVLHELAHLIVPVDQVPEALKKQIGFLSDFHDDAAQDHNADMLNKYCGKVIRKF